MLPDSKSECTAKGDLEDWRETWKTGGGPGKLEGVWWAPRGGAGGLGGPWDLMGFLQRPAAGLRLVAGIL